ncbi:hypothetical protein HHI36_011774 [Cryptolaemus montrouzieri]|uniref:Uncharacterized protein n=1 Tax=Cryptolaemus montrouzieri TaxID=559131 RepID=A0ABD2NC72_9CUCU
MVQCATDEMEFGRDFGKDIIGTASVWKCDLLGAPDSCEYFIKDFRLSKLCEKIPEKNQAWTTFVEAFDPKLTCPIKKGKYLVTQQVKEDVFRFFPVPTGLWKVKGGIIENGKMVFCLDFHAKVFESKQ